MDSKKKSLAIPEFPPFVDILGTPWKITVLKNSEDPIFEKEHCCGACYENEKLIKILDTRTSRICESESQEFHNDAMKEALRHEIVHAFLYESGLGEDALRSASGWAVNEEMVDWFASQGQKIYMAWEKTGCLRVMSPERWSEWMEWKKKQQEA